jgi:hypothetical protein
MSESRSEVKPFDEGRTSDLVASSDCSFYFDQLLHLSVGQRWDSLVYNVTVPACFVTAWFRIWGQSDTYGIGSQSTPYNGIGNQTTSLTTMSPVVSTQCTDRDVQYTEAKVDIGPDYLFENGTLAGNLFSIHTLIDHVSNFTGSGNVTTRVTTELSDKTVKRVVYPPIWTSSPERDAHALVVVFPYWTQYYDTFEEPESITGLLTQPDDSKTFGWGWTIKACTISASWRTGEIQLIEKSGQGVIQPKATAMSVPYKAKPITLDVTGIENIQGPEFYRDLSELTQVEEGLSVLFAQAIATSGNYTDLEEQPPPGYDQKNITVFPINTILYGYGYGGRSVSVQLAMAVITMYSVVTIAYITYILVTGSTSTAWNSAIELVALALQSKTPDHLGNIGAGLDSIETFKEGVGIRVNKNNELELVFARDRNIRNRGLRQIAQNREY